MLHVRQLLCLLLLLMLSACHYEHPELSENWDITKEQRDSLTFALTHHYWLNYNFEVTTDSLILHDNLPDEVLPDLVMNDSVAVYHGNRLVVADVRSVTKDSTGFWIKVARDQETMGWIKESVLLAGVVPCDPISQFIHAFSGRHLFLLYLLAGIVALMAVWRRVRHKQMPAPLFHDIHSFYPTLLCLLTAAGATLYGTIQRFVPETWAEFYYHPTLNPFGQPFVLAAFLCTVWLMLIVLLAAVDDVRRQLTFSTAVSYLFTLICICLVLYIFFSLLSQFYIGYILLLAFCYLAVRHYLRHYAMRYVCGRCGEPMKTLGKCPHCGAIND